MIVRPTNNEMKFIKFNVYFNMKFQKILKLEILLQFELWAYHHCLLIF